MQDSGWLPCEGVGDAVEPGVAWRRSLSQLPPCLARCVQYSVSVDPRLYLAGSKIETPDLGTPTTVGRFYRFSLVARDACIETEDPKDLDDFFLADCEFEKVRLLSMSCNCME